MGAEQSSFAEGESEAEAEAEAKLRARLERIPEWPHITSPPPTASAAAAAASAAAAAAAAGPPTPLLHFPAAERNKEFIADALSRFAPFSSSSLAMSAIDSPWQNKKAFSLLSLPKCRTPHFCHMSKIHFK